MGEASEPAPSREPKPALARETLVVFAAERECERELEHGAGPDRGNLYRRRSAAHVACALAARGVEALREVLRSRQSRGRTPHCPLVASSCVRTVVLSQGTRVACGAAHVARDLSARGAEAMRGMLRF